MVGPSFFLVKLNFIKLKTHIKLIVELIPLKNGITNFDKSVAYLKLLSSNSTNFLDFNKKVILNSKTHCNIAIWE